MIPSRSVLLRMRKAELVDLVLELAVVLGPIGLEVQAALAQLAEQGDLPGPDRAKGATALALAWAIDSGKAGLATAGIAKELRVTLTELEEASKDRHGTGDVDPAADLDSEMEGLTSG